MVKWVEVADQRFFHEGAERRLETRLRFLETIVQHAPFLIVLVSLLRILLHAELFPDFRLHLHGLLESIRIDFLENGLQGDEGLLEDLVPVVLGEVHDDGHQHGESLVLICLQDVQEVVVFEEAHGSICHLQVVSPNALHDSFK